MLDLCKRYVYDSGMKLTKCFIFLMLGVVAFGADDQQHKSPISDKTMGEWWKTVAIQNALAKQFTDAQAIVQTVPQQYVANDQAKKAVEDKIAKECEAVKLSFVLDTNSGEPTCIIVPAPKKDEVKPVSADKKK